MKFILITALIALMVLTSCNSNPQTHTGPKDITNTTAAEIVAEMRVGWNLGNTLDAFGDTPEGFSWLGDGTFAGTSVEEMEIAWLGEDAVVTTQRLFDTLKAAGFNTVRIPVTWYKAVDADNDYKIRADWMARVKEVVDYAVNNDMYIILNTHHDEDIFKFLNDEMPQSLRAFELIWTQIAETFRDYDEKLIFEGLNEPRTKYSRNEWSGGTKEERLNINTYNQLFVNTVRATGGNNAYRALMITPHAASSETTVISDLRMPRDTIRNRIIVSIHAYTPWEFALRTDEEAVLTWSRNNRSDTNPIHHMLNRLYDEFIAKDIPVIIGEMGAVNRDNIEDRVSWTEFYVSAARKFGIPCIWWDNGMIEGEGELFGLIDRQTYEFHYPEILQALMEATK
jgi:endoglucanase